MANTLKFGNGKWYGKEGTILAYNDENYNYKPLPFNFERGSSATVINKDGLIETVGSGQPRIDYKDDSKGALLLEPTRSNSLLQSNQFDTTWLKSSGVTITSEQAISPDGNNNGWKFEKTAASYKSIGQGYTSSSETTFSIFAKKGTLSIITLFANISGGTNLYQRFDLENGTLSSGSGMSNSNIEDFGNGWYRCSSTFTNANVTSLDFFAEFGETNEGYIYIYGGQVEQGSYATSYIPTQGSSATRLADECNGAGNEQVINSSEGVLYAEIAGLANDGTNRRITISDGAGSNDVGFRFNNVSNQIQVVSYINSTVVVNQTYVLPDITVIKKYALKWALNNYALWVDGVEVITNNSAISFPQGTLNTLNFASGTNTNNFYGKAKALAVYNTALTDIELKALTT